MQPNMGWGCESVARAIGVSICVFWDMEGAKAGLEGQDCKQAVVNT